MEEHEFQFLAAQLRKPSGEEGEKVGARMFENNLSMIRGAIDLLPIGEGDTILEIGYGNGLHLEYLFQKSPNIRYVGVDISETMQKEASKNNRTKIEAGIAQFLLGDGINLPVEDSAAAYVFTVNTVYFWEDHAAVLQEVKRVLKSGGKFCLAFASRNFMEKLSFTKYGFRLFHPSQAETLLIEEGFLVTQTLIHKEPLQGPFKEIGEREVVLVLAQKPA